MPVDSSLQTPQHLGRIEKFTADSNGGHGIAANGQFRVSAFNDRILRITLTKYTAFDDFSYSVVAKPQAISVTVEESATTISIKTSALSLVIDRDPLRFAVYDGHGNLLNEDEQGLTTSWIGDQVTTYKKLQEGERFIGLGEKTGALDRRGSGYQNWTTDAYAYHGGQDPLYCSTPFYIGIHGGLCYGIFLDNTYKTFFNFGASNNRFSSFGADAGEMNYYFIGGDSVAQVIQEYTHLTGRMEMPPQWSIGYQQCRYSYYPDAEVLSLARTFREKDIPADAIVLDIHYMDRYKIFTWDKKHFPDPKRLIEELNTKGFHVVVMCDPGIKVEPGYHPFDSGVSADIFLKYPDSKNYEGQVWPGWCNFPDFTNPQARTWWAAQFKDYVSLGIEGFWNDMNEIATWGNALPENIVFDFDGNPASTRRGRNVFGFQMARSTYEGTKKLLGGKRPFNLTRSGFAGVQRYAAVWTGDNVSYDEHMLLGVRLVNSLGLTGISFAGYDVGGFVGDANTKLYARWISIGALSPFFRGHTMINSRDSEPWSYGEEVEQIARNYVKFRYQLLPYLYSLFDDASRTGLPVQRSLAIPYTHDPLIYQGTYHNQYLLGPFILVAPVESSRELAKVYLPEGSWYYLFDGKHYQGNEEIIVDSPIHRLPVFIKGGAIIPMQSAVAHTGEKTEELIVHVYHGSDPTEFTWYSDDGQTFDYQNGNYSRRVFSFIPSERKIKIGATEGSFSTHFKKIKFVFHRFEAFNVEIDGTAFNLRREAFSFFTAMEKYDPIADPESMGEEMVSSTEVEYTAGAIEVHW